MKNFKTALLPCVVFSLFLPFVAAADPNAQGQYLSEKVQEAAQSRDALRINFWLTRYIGEISTNPQTSWSLENVQEALDALSAPTLVLSSSGNYDQSFKDWLLTRTQQQWAVEEGRLNGEGAIQMSSGNGAVDYGNGSQSNYFVLLHVTPKIYKFYIDNEKEILPMGDFAIVPSITCGTVNSNPNTLVYYHSASLDTGSFPLQHIWGAKFEDVDGDRIPEVFFRYNLIDSGSITQELAVYKFEGSDLVLIKKFSAPNAGIVRKIDGGRVQVIHGDMGKVNLTLETWESKGKDFVQINSETISNPLRSEAWKEYYFTDEKLF